RAQRQLLIRLTTRSPERERMTRAFLLTKTYMDAGDSPRIATTTVYCALEPPIIPRYVATI
ncbi:MAG: hypothetical protein ABSA94_01315, partial [Acidobacteriaceae bacterium]